MEVVPQKAVARQQVIEVVEYHDDSDWTGASDDWEEEIVEIVERVSPIINPQQAPRSNVAPVEVGIGVPPSPSPVLLQEKEEKPAKNIEQQKQPDPERAPVHSASSALMGSQQQLGEGDDEQQQQQQQQQPDFLGKSIGNSSKRDRRAASRRRSISDSRIHHSTSNHNRTSLNMSSSDNNSNDDNTNNKNQTTTQERRRRAPPKTLEKNRSFIRPKAYWYYDESESSNESTSFHFTGDATFHANLKIALGEGSATTSGGNGDGDDLLGCDGDDRSHGGASTGSGSGSQQSKRQFTRKEFIYAICVGVLLSFNAGYVNGTCLTGLLTESGRKVNVTSHAGTLTLSAVFLASGDIDEFGFFTSMMLCFMLGSYIAGLLTPNATTFRIEPNYGATFLLGSAFLTASSVMAAVRANEKYVFYLASAANGIQNGMSSLYSGNLIRSTGLTGTATDIGIFLAQIVRGNKKNAWNLVVLLCLFQSFWLGGLISLYATSQFIEFSLLVNAILFFLIGISLIMFLTLELDVSLGAAIFGTWQWRRALDQLHKEAFRDAAPGGFKKGSHQTTVERMDELFDRMDSDRSGTIDINELRAALKMAGVKITRRETMQMIKKADTNGDGELSRDEWRNIATLCHERHERERASRKLIDLDFSSSSEPDNSSSNHNDGDDGADDRGSPVVNEEEHDKKDCVDGDDDNNNGDEFHNETSTGTGGDSSADAYLNENSSGHDNDTRSASVESFYNESGHDKSVDGFQNEGSFDDSDGFHNDSNNRGRVRSEKKGG